MRFESLVLKNLVRRPMRSLLTLIALATAIAAVVALLGISQGFTKSFGQIYEAHSVDVVVSRQGAADRLSSSIDQELATDITKLPGVDRAAAVLLETLSLEDLEIYGIPTQGIASDSWLLGDYELDQVAGASQPVGQSSQNDTAGDQQDINKASSTVMLGIHLAERIDAKVGDALVIFDEPFEINGIFKSTSTWENGSMILPLPELQRLTAREGQATYINVVLDKPLSAEDAQKAIDSIQALDSKIHPLTTAEFVEEDLRMQLAGAMAWMTSVIALVIGSIGTLNTMLTSVMERTSEIGILRAIGWPRGRVIRMILMESCGLAILASLLGTVLAVLMTWGLSQAPAAKGILNPSIDVGTIFQGLALGLGIGLVGALLPAWRASRMLPTEAFREATI